MRRRIGSLQRKLSGTPPKRFQVAVIVVVAVLLPVYFVFGPLSIKPQAGLGAFLTLCAYVLVIVGFISLALAIAGSDLTTKEQDKKIGEAVERYRDRYRWVALLIVFACFIYVAYEIYAYA